MFTCFFLHQSPDFRCSEVERSDINLGQTKSTAPEPGCSECN